MQDIVAVVDGRDELVGEFADSPPELRRYLSGEIQSLLEQSRFIDALFGFLRGDMASQARVEAVVLPRLREIAAQSVSAS
jgi:hypothetical protein